MEPNEQSALPVSDASTREKEQLKPLQSLFEWLEIIVFSFLIVMVVITFLARHSPVSGRSMMPTLHEHDVLITSNLFYTPARGDIIVVQDIGEAIGLDEPLVKRVIALAGDTVEIDFDNWVTKVTTPEGEIIVYENEPYVNRVTGAMRNPVNHMTYPLKVDEGCLFVMGDNRNGSSDSRDSRIGLVDERYIVGHAIFRIFPLDRIGSMIGA